MRALTTIAVLLAGGASSLCAQHGGDIEIGGYGSYTRYDSRLQLDDQFGAGGRLGFFLGDHFSLEIDGNMSQPLSRFSGVGRTTATFGSAPYASDLNAVHGGIGERVFFVSDRAALRLEARAYYRPPGTTPGTLDRVVHITAMAGMSFILGPGGNKN
ncbi:MAG: hypothetical protein DMD67_02215 [Gemmatimonadetes bacterium]|nr:MAG: hypothetical protein DMD67_02215 [Gemmatimonadota bacterium]